MDASKRRGRAIFSKEINRRRKLRLAGTSKPLFRKPLNVAVRRYAKMNRLLSEMYAAEKELLALKKAVESSGEEWKPQWQTVLEKVRASIKEASEIRAGANRQRGGELMDWEVLSKLRKSGITGTVRLALAGSTARAKLNRLKALKKVSK